MTFRLDFRIKSIVLIACSFFFVGCLEDEKKVNLEEVKAELVGVEFDKKSISKFIDVAKTKLVGLKMAEKDLRKAGEINKAIS
ncbi:MAG: hypothetical protein HN869_03330, partial [Verrucomicrobia bacterium]|nr:hypothetical protein [Verrucomicrobiota bacterium]